MLLTKVPSSRMLAETTLFPVPLASFVMTANKQQSQQVLLRRAIGARTVGSTHNRRVGASLLLADGEGGGEAGDEKGRCDGELHDVEDDMLQ